ncbi:MAG: hydrogenase maturation nickel metallochaperone HypA [Pseudomonadota bacterium]
MVIAQNVVKIVEDEVGSRKLRGKVERVLFRAGKMNAVIPEILRFNFDVLKKDHPILSEANLEISEIPIQVRCDACGKKGILDEPFFLCLECGSPVTVETGQEMFVERITFKEE